VGIEQRDHMVGITGAWVAGVQHKRLGGQLGEGGRRRQQRVAGRQYRHQSILHQYTLVNGWVVDADTPEADINAPGLERFDLLQGGHLGQTQFQLQRVMAAQPPDQLGQYAIQSRRRKADAQPGLFALADAPGAVADLVQLFEQHIGVFIEKPPGFGQSQRAAAFQQNHPQLILQLLDLPAQRWLGDVQAFGGPGEVEGFAQHLEVAQMTQFHDGSFHTLRVLFETNSILAPRKEREQNQRRPIKNPAGIAMPICAIESIETIIVDLPTIRPHKLAMHTMQNQTLVIIRVRCADGIEGIGESTTIGGLSYGNESPDSIKINIDRHFAPLLIGQDASNINAAMLRLERSIRGNTFAKSGIESALLDALGKRLNLPVSELLGGRVRDALPVAWTLASGNTEQDIAEAEKMLDLRRHRIFKLKIGAGEVGRDLAHVIAIKKALGERASVRVDVNQAWDEAVALRACKVLGDNGIDLIEQPISRNNRGGMARLNLSSPAPIMADESIECVEDAFNLAREGAASVFALKIAKNGGPRAVLRTAAIAEAAGIGLYGGTMLEGGIGTLASAHAFLTLNKLAWDTELFGPLLLTEDILTEPPVYRDFQLHVSTAPGLGLAIDEERLAFFRRDKH
jgi:muconate cycloisomerase